MLFIHFKTTGLDPKQHEILHIQAIELDAHGHEVRMVDQPILPQRPELASSVALDMYGPIPSNAIPLDEFKPFATPEAVICHNSDFVKSFYPWDKPFFWCDLMCIGIALKHKGLISNVKLSTIARYAGIDFDSNLASVIRQIYEKFEAVL